MSNYDTREIDDFLDVRPSEGWMPESAAQAFAAAAALAGALFVLGLLFVIL